MKKLHVVTCISNPVRFKSRYKLYREFAERMLKEPDVIFWTAELAFGDRPHEITDYRNPNHLQVRSPDELWHKENLQNLMVERIPDDGLPIAFIDADVIFMNPHWVRETVEQLEHYEVVQMFSQSIDLGPNYGLVKGETRIGMAYSFTQGIPAAEWVSTGYDQRQLKTGGHCGYAWAWRRSAFNTVGGLFDRSFVGASDWFMACGLMGEIDIAIPGNAHPNFRRRLLEWGERARGLRRNVGYVEGLLGHYWHGPKSQRGYFWRNSILETELVDPDVDLIVDAQGVHHLNDDGTDRYMRIRNNFRNYFRSRNEDSMEEVDEPYK